MGGRKPKKNSSGKADAHKASQAKHAAARDAAKPRPDKKEGGKK